MKYNPQFENKYSISIISWIRKLMPSWGMHDLCNIASYLAPNPGFDGLSFKFNFISVFSITPLLKMEKAKQLLNVSLLGVLSFFLFSLVLNYYFFFFFARQAPLEDWVLMHGLCAPTLLFLATKNSLFLFSLQDSLSSHFLSTCGSLSWHSSYHPPATSFLLRGILTKSTREQAHGHSIPWASMSPLSWFTDFSLPHTIFFLLFLHSVHTTVFCLHRQGVRDP